MVMVVDGVPTFARPRQSHAGPIHRAFPTTVPCMLGIASQLCQARCKSSMGHDTCTKVDLHSEDIGKISDRLYLYDLKLWVCCGVTEAVRSSGSHVTPYYAEHSVQ